jgi:Domain of unknown function (DUF4365)
MEKTVASSKFSEWKGIDRITAAVHDMHCIFREISKDDFGIDGEIEVVVRKEDEEGYKTTGGIIKLQSKSGNSYIKHDSDTAFYVYVKQQDLELWNGANYPVIFVVYHPHDDKLYWKDVKTYIKTTPQIYHPPLRIAFDKMKDLFDENCYEAMCDLAQTSPPPVSFQQQERLFSNLLLVKHAPGTITQANTTYQLNKEIWAQTQWTPPFVIRAGKLYTLDDLRNPDCVLRPFCDTSTIRDVIAQQWITDEQCRRDYIFLLNQLLSSYLRRCGLRYNRDYKRYYFPREDDTRTEFKRDWFNVRTSRAVPARIVAKYYHYGLEYFWRHLAVQLTFEYIGDDLCLQILPKYLFTIDGQVTCDPEKVGPYTTKLEAMERNIHVLNHILFWVDILSQGTPSIDIQLTSKTLLVIEKVPLSGIAPFAIVNDPAIHDETEQNLQPLLFDFVGKEDDDSFYL